MESFVTGLELTQGGALPPSSFRRVGTAGTEAANLQTEDAPAMSLWAQVGSPPSLPIVDVRLGGADASALEGYRRLGRDLGASTYIEYRVGSAGAAALQQLLLVSEGDAVPAGFEVLFAFPPSVGGRRWSLAAKRAELAQSSPADLAAWLAAVAAGAEADVCCGDGVWRTGVVRGVEGGRAHVTFHGWPDRFDERGVAAADLAPPGSRVAGRPALTSAYCASKKGDSCLLLLPPAALHGAASRLGAVLAGEVAPAAAAPFLSYDLPLTLTHFALSEFAVVPSFPSVEDRVEGGEGDARAMHASWYGPPPPEAQRGREDGLSTGPVEVGHPCFPCVPPFDARPPVGPWETARRILLGMAAAAAAAGTPDYGPVYGTLAHGLVGLALAWASMHLRAAHTPLPPEAVLTLRMCLLSDEDRSYVWNSRWSRTTRGEGVLQSMPLPGGGPFESLASRLASSGASRLFTRNIELLHECGGWAALVSRLALHAAASEAIAVAPPKAPLPDFHASSGSIEEDGLLLSFVVHVQYCTNKGFGAHYFGPLRDAGLARLAAVSDRQLKRADRSVIDRAREALRRVGECLLSALGKDSGVEEGGAHGLFWSDHYAGRVGLDEVLLGAMLHGPGGAVPGVPFVALSRPIEESIVAVGARLLSCEGLGPRVKGLSDIGALVELLWEKSGPASKSVYGEARLFHTPEGGAELLRRYRVLDIALGVPEAVAGASDGNALAASLPSLRPPFEPAHVQVLTRLQLPAAFAARLADKARAEVRKIELVLERMAREGKEPIPMLMERVETNRAIVAADRGATLTPAQLVYLWASWATSPTYEEARRAALTTLSSVLFHLPPYALAILHGRVRALTAPGGPGLIDDAVVAFTSAFACAYAVAEVREGSPRPADAPVPPIATVPGLAQLWSTAQSAVLPAEGGGARQEQPALTSAAAAALLAALREQPALGGKRAIAAYAGECASVLCRPSGVPTPRLSASLLLRALCEAAESGEGGGSDAALVTSLETAHGVRSALVADAVRGGAGLPERLATLQWWSTAAGAPLTTDDITRLWAACAPSDAFFDWLRGCVEGGVLSVAVVEALFTALTAGGGGGPSLALPSLTKAGLGLLWSLIKAVAIAREDMQVFPQPGEEGDISVMSPALPGVELLWRALCEAEEEEVATQAGAKLLLLNSAHCLQLDHEGKGEEEAIARLSSAARSEGLASLRRVRALPSPTAVAPPDTLDLPSTTAARVYFVSLAMAMLGGGGKTSGRPRRILALLTAFLAACDEERAEEARLDLPDLPDAAVDVLFPFFDSPLVARAVASYTARALEPTVLTVHVTEPAPAPPASARPLSPYFSNAPPLSREVTRRVDVKLRMHVETAAGVHARLAEAMGLPPSRLAVAWPNRDTAPEYPVAHCLAARPRSTLATSITAQLLEASPAGTGGEAAADRLTRVAAQVERLADYRNSARVKALAEAGDADVDTTEVLEAEKAAGVAGWRGWQLAREARWERVRATLSDTPAHFDALFALLDGSGESAVVTPAWELLTSLPTPDHLARDVATVWGAMEGAQPEWGAVLDGGAPLRLLFTLSVIEKGGYLGGDGAWGSAFSASGGLARVADLVATLPSDTLLGRGDRLLEACAAALLRVLCALPPPPSPASLVAPLLEWLSLATTGEGGGEALPGLVASAFRLLSLCLLAVGERALTSFPSYGDVLATALIAPPAPGVRAAAAAGLASLLTLLPSLAPPLADAVLAAFPFAYAFPAHCLPLADAVGALLPTASPSFPYGKHTAALADLLLRHPRVEAARGGQDEVLLSLLRALTLLLARSSNAEARASAGASLLPFLFHSVLFPQPGEGEGPLAVREESRTAAEKLLLEAARGIPVNAALAASLYLLHHDAEGLEEAGSGALVVPPPPGLKDGGRRGRGASSSDDDWPAHGGRSSRSRTFPVLTGWGWEGRREWAEPLPLTHPSLHGRPSATPNGIDSRAECGYVGIRNLGCICYANSTLQQFFMNQPFRTAVLSYQPPPGVGEEEAADSLPLQLQGLFARLQESGRQDADPGALCRSIKDWDGLPTNVYEQKDVPEFLTKLFSDWEGATARTPLAAVPKALYEVVTALESSAGDPRPSPPSGPSLYRVKEEEHLFLQMKVGGRVHSLEAALTGYVGGEQLDAPCSWDLPGGGEGEVGGSGGGPAAPPPASVPLPTFRRASLLRTSPCLMVHLNRFEFDLESMAQVKLNDRFEFPTSLDLWPHTLWGRPDPLPGACVPPPPPPRSDFLYTLVGVVVHSGTAVGGHYYSYARQVEAGCGPSPADEWLEFNDSRVEKWAGTAEAFERDCFGGVDPHASGGRGRGRTRTANAFVLFYERTREGVAASASPPPPSGEAAVVRLPGPGPRPALLTLPAGTAGAHSAALSALFGRGGSAARASMRAPLPPPLAASLAAENASFWRTHYIFRVTYFNTVLALVEGAAEAAVPCGFAPTAPPSPCTCPASPSLRLCLSFTLNTLPDAIDDLLRERERWGAAMQALAAACPRTAAWALARFASRPAPLLRVALLDKPEADGRSGKPVKARRAQLALALGACVDGLWREEGAALPPLPLFEAWRAVAGEAPAPPTLPLGATSPAFLAFWISLVAPHVRLLGHGPGRGGPHTAAIAQLALATECGPLALTAGALPYLVDAVVSLAVHSRPHAALLDGCTRGVLTLALAGSLSPADWTALCRPDWLAALAAWGFGGEAGSEQASIVQSVLESLLHTWAPPPRGSPPSPATRLVQAVLAVAVEGVTKGDWDSLGAPLRLGFSLIPRGEGVVAEVVDEIMSALGPLLEEQAHYFRACERALALLVRAARERPALVEWAGRGAPLAWAPRWLRAFPLSPVPSFAPAYPPLPPQPALLKPRAGHFGTASSAYSYGAPLPPVRSPSLAANVARLAQGRRPPLTRLDPDREDEPSVALGRSVDVAMEGGGEGVSYSPRVAALAPRPLVWRRGIVASLLNEGGRGLVRFAVDLLPPPSPPPASPRALLPSLPPSRLSLDLFDPALLYRFVGEGEGEPEEGEGGGPDPGDADEGEGAEDPLCVDLDSPPGPARFHPAPVAMPPPLSPRGTLGRANRTPRPSPSLARAARNARMSEREGAVLPPSLTARRPPGEQVVGEPEPSVASSGYSSLSGADGGDSTDSDEDAALQATLLESLGSSSTGEGVHFGFGDTPPRSRTAGVPGSSPLTTARIVPSDVD